MSQQYYVDLYLGGTIVTLIFIFIILLIARYILWILGRNSARIALLNRKREGHVFLGKDVMRLGPPMRLVDKSLATVSIIGAGTVAMRWYLLNS